MPCYLIKIKYYLFSYEAIYTINKSGNGVLLVNHNSKFKKFLKSGGVWEKMLKMFITVILKYHLWWGVVVCGKSCQNTFSYEAIYTINKSGNGVLLVNHNSKFKKFLKSGGVWEKMLKMFITVILKYHLWWGVVVCGKSCQNTLVSTYVKDFSSGFNTWVA